MDKILSAAVDAAEMALSRVYLHSTARKGLGSPRLNDLASGLSPQPKKAIVPPRASWGLTEAELLEGYEKVQP